MGTMRDGLSDEAKVVVSHNGLELGSSDQFSVDVQLMRIQAMHHHVDVMVGDGAKIMIVIESAKSYGLISSELGFSDVMAYENKEITEEELWERFEENALGEA